MFTPRRLALFAALAFVVSGVLALVATFVERGGIEADLASRTREALARSGLAAEKITFSGRDALVRAGSPQDVPDAATVVENVDGVRSATVTGSAEQAPGPPSEPDRRPEAATDPDAAAKARFQRDLDEALADNPIRFGAYSTKLDAEDRDTVEEVADLVAETPTDWRFEVGGHTLRVPDDDPESAEELSYERAVAVVEELADQGVSPDRLQPAGYGHTRPVSDSGMTPIDRRVEVTVR